MVEDAVGQIEHGSFHWVLEVFKPYGAGLVEEVNQVRKYRNWVAHGRRPKGRMPFRLKQHTWENPEGGDQKGDCNIW